jgi:hypothetical protein
VGRRSVRQVRRRERRLHLTAALVAGLDEPEQVYVNLWSHAGGAPAHIHFVVQPVTLDVLARVNARGPALQAAMFAVGELSDAAGARTGAGGIANRRTVRPDRARMDPPP